MNKKLFLSAVSSEFESYRRLLAGDLKRPTLDVAVQEDFDVSGTLTLQKLDDYIKACDGVVHLIGKATGAPPQPSEVRALLEAYPDFATELPALAEDLKRPDPGFSYTQWDAYLAIYHERPVFIYLPTDFQVSECQCPREDRFVYDAEQEESQQAHYQRISTLGRDCGQFANQERLSSAVLRDLVDILPALESHTDVPPTRQRHTAQVLIGRDAELTVLDAAWPSAGRCRSTSPMCICTAPASSATAASWPRRARSSNATATGAARKRSKTPKRRWVWSEAALHMKSAPSLGPLSVSPPLPEMATGERTHTPGPEWNFSVLPCEHLRERGRFGGGSEGAK